MSRGTSHALNDGMSPSSRFPLRALLGARAGEDVEHAVVALVAGVFVDAVGGLPHREFHGPRTRPRVRIVDRELVEQRIPIHPAEALDESKLLACAPERAL